jgi:magnesium chelatase accessory protein
MTSDRPAGSSGLGSTPPVREQSVAAGGLRWRVLRAGRGPEVLLLHGSGATIHSWAGILPLLARHFSVVAADLPGHGETGMPDAARLALPGVAGLVTALVRELRVDPMLAIGHSAGAAIAARMTLDGAIHPRGLVGLNPALAAMDAPVPAVLAPLVNRIARSRFVARVVANFAAQPGRVESTLRATGSVVPPDHLEAYRRYAANPDHVNAVLTMMSHWDLAPLVRDLPRLPVPLLLILGDGDRWIAPGPLDAVTRDVPQLLRVVVPGSGHLTHEERPFETFREIMNLARMVGAVSREEERGTREE